jgi:hypothetical protein
MSGKVAETAETTESLNRQLLELKAEHTDLDLTIAHLSRRPPDDDLLLRRLKKRKLLLKDRIGQIERKLALGPDEYA